MSVSKANLRDALPSGADLINSLFRFAKVNSAGQLVVCDTAGETVYGSLSEVQAGAGRGATVDIDGILKVVAGGTVATGAKVATNASGAAVTASTGNVVVGIARKGGASGTIIEVTRIASVAS